MPIFTDGSREGEAAGAAAVSPNLIFQDSLPRCASNFTAELWAIAMALGYIATRKNEDSQCTVFRFPSAALMALLHLTPSNSLVLKIQRFLRELHFRKKVTFCWVPAHVGVRDNERSDRAAKEACGGGRRWNILPVSLEGGTLPH